MKMELNVFYVIQDIIQMKKEKDVLNVQKIHILIKKVHLNVYFVLKVLVLK